MYAVDCYSEVVIRSGVTVFSFFILTFNYFQIMRKYIFALNLGF
jgi:hypothetical protein